MSTALITGASQGLGRALTLALTERNWHVIVDARGPDGLEILAHDVPSGALLTAITGDVADEAHRAALVEAVDGAGGLDLLVNNASTLGPTPLSPVTSTSAGQLADVLQVNTIAPLELSKALLPWLRRSAGTVVNISSDAAVEHYAGWGLYGASKAALDHLTLTMAAEHPEIHWYAVDPGDMRTAMQQRAFPGEDISDRAEPENVAPALLQLLSNSPASGRYRLADVLATAETAR
jgi:NAD(P)-dependent dehydrogenase (short-subunit alcohol dehydrogenase family)